jgi:hypothetical protein
MPSVEEVASTGNVCVIPLGLADKVKISGIDNAPRWRDDLEPHDWTPAGWGVTPT